MNLVNAVNAEGYFSFVRQYLGCDVQNQEIYEVIRKKHSEPPTYQVVKQ